MSEHQQPSADNERVEAELAEWIANARDHYRPPPTHPEKFGERLHARQQTRRRRQQLLIALGVVVALGAGVALSSIPTATPESRLKSSHAACRKHG